MEVYSIIAYNGQKMNVGYTKPKFSKRMLTYLQPEIKRYITDLQKNNIVYNPDDFTKIYNRVIIKYDTNKNSGNYRNHYNKDDNEDTDDIYNYRYNSKQDRNQQNYHKDKYDKDSYSYDDQNNQENYEYQDYKRYRQLQSDKTYNNKLNQDSYQDNRSSYSFKKTPKTNIDDPNQLKTKQPKNKKNYNGCIEDEYWETQQAKDDYKNKKAKDYNLEQNYKYGNSYEKVSKYDMESNFKDLDRDN